MDGRTWILVGAKCDILEEKGVEAVTDQVRNASNPWRQFFGPNLGYLEACYEQFVKDPTTVEPALREMFDKYGPPSSLPAAPLHYPVQPERMALDPDLLRKVASAGKLAWNIRAFGHLAADIDPLHMRSAPDTRLLEPGTYQLTEADLSALPATLVWEDAPPDIRNGWEAIRRLRSVYTKTLAYEFSHVHEEVERDWLNHQAESELSPEPLTAQERIVLLNRLIEVQQFESFLQRTFVGQKRFSIEGNDVLVPMIDEIVRIIAEDGASHILMGMAHRGRLSVLAHVLGKPFSKIFSEFHHSPNKDLFPSEGSRGINYGWTGDVKYHLGAFRSLREGGVVRTRLTLANNPSHLEFVNPVVEGFSRAAQDDRSKPGFPVQDVRKAAAVLIHGDAAFPGEGIVAETLNFNKLRGYQNGGTLHIIVNNQLGFTTESRDGRSTYYASDLAKGFEIPIVHVNADDPEACIEAIRIACHYRDRFHKDFLIDLVGYRRYGHNETDDPETTQPLMYGKLKRHAVISKIYTDRLKKEGLVNDEQVARMEREALNKLQEAYDEVKQVETRKVIPEKQEMIEWDQADSIDTAVPYERLKEINDQLLRWPQDFHVYPKLKRILERRASAFDEGEKVDWALAETLAFATILADGHPIRLSGQDVERGTFAHRHLILHDSITGDTYSPLHMLPQAKASFAIHNSPLSEQSVLGFEYGYNVYSPETIVLWEAQYGDFANSAQVVIDQFISAGRSKWSQLSSLVMLLPHGFEGQGPEHSSARLERYLQLSGDNNWVVANVTCAAQYFHLLRRHAAQAGTVTARPLILMTPKSLIRSPSVASPNRVFTEGKFHPVKEQSGLGEQPGEVERLLVCSGKIAIDLETELRQNPDSDWRWLHIVRIEQLYPFPDGGMRRVMERLPNVKDIVWVQEDPQNMGAWLYMEPRLRELSPAGAVVRYIGRPERSSPASGYQNMHVFEQERILKAALKRHVPQLVHQGGSGYE